MSLSGYDFKDGLREVSRGLTSLGESVERAMDNYVQMQREKAETGQEIAQKLTDAINAAVEELRKP